MCAYDCSYAWNEKINEQINLRSTVFDYFEFKEMSLEAEFNPKSKTSIIVYNLMVLLWVILLFIICTFPELEFS